MNFLTQSIRVYIIFSLLIPRSHVYSCKSFEKNAETRLVDCLFGQETYNFVRPILHSNESIVVQVTSALYNIEDLNEAEETITFIEWLTVSYKSEYYTWDPQEYDGVTSLNVPFTKVWVPDVHTINARKVEPLADDSRLLATIYSSGVTSVSFARKVTTMCAIDVADFPFDTQICENLAVGFSYDARRQNLSVLYQGNEFRKTLNKLYRRNREWALLNYSAEVYLDNLSSGGYEFSMPKIVFSIKMVRNPSFFLFAYAWPAALITFIAIIGLYTPSDHTLNRTERISLGSTAILALAVVFMGLFGIMPAGSNMPRLGAFLLEELMIVVVCTAVSACIMHVNSSHMVATFITKRMHQRKATNQMAQLDQKAYISDWCYWLDVLLMVLFLLINSALTYNIMFDSEHQKLLDSPDVIHGI